MLCQQNILSHSTPGQQARLLKDLADAWLTAAEPLTFANEISVEASSDPQQCRLATARWPNDRDDLSGSQCQLDPTQHRQRVAISMEGFALNVQSKNYVRHRIAQFSSGCMTAHSIDCATRRKASV